MDPQKRIAELEQKIKELELLLKMPSDSVSNEEHESVKKELIRARQYAEDANRSKTMFLANMSHEIRTPMNSIIGIYNVLSQTELSDEQKEFLEIINISSHNLLAIINDILDLSKIEAGQLKLEHKPFSIQEEIHQVIKLLSIKAKGKGINLFSRIQSSVPSCTIGDPSRIRQILVNLANNAIKFTNEGQVVISVETIDLHSSYGKSTSPEYIPENFHDISGQTSEAIILKFEVTDTGIGISHEDQQNLFNEFAQLENPLIQKFEGTGLGLSISKNLTRLMNGKIGVISEKGKGSTFWFTLALEKGDEELLRKDLNQHLPGKKSIRSLSILLVEDNLLNQKFAMTSLQRAGHKVDLAENGKIAVEKHRRTKYDLILMDIAMPIMDGLEATRIIREIEKERAKDSGAVTAKPVRIVAITAHVMVTDRDKCIAAGMDEYLAKPYRPQELISIIEGFNWD
ncbi:MAG: ATP-binding protein [Bacteroidales bacterium]|nr:ATP-binding protein [Bacteroidales bacterium]